ncbi:hypothetical protein [Listeria phage LMTA-148]|uniref:Uncharacterized protein n=1 Tax=Listeria phage LMTA-148 TaxID=1486413 RepID=A0A068CBQ5_9CAUD|nr:hypothetical protein LD12_gp017 [Listeria phage LMTA-148]AID17294.1 hypothetical protein [Listeria phage LMTA-148]
MVGLGNYYTIQSLTMSHKLSKDVANEEWVSEQFEDSIEGRIKLNNYTRATMNRSDYVFNKGMLLLFIGALLLIPLVTLI